MHEDSPEIEILRALVAGREELVSRLAAPLWARVGQALDGDLSWARALLGEKGPSIIMNSLFAVGAINPDTRILRGRQLSLFLSSLLGEGDIVAPALAQSSVVWTLPYTHAAHNVRGHSYLNACVGLITEAKQSLALISPFVDAGGVGTLLTPLVSALSRKVEVRLFVHDALNIGTPTSRALEELRREAEHISGNLSVYSAEAGVGGDRLLNPLFHAKLIICDRHALLLGSANLTSYGLGSNFEAGALLGEEAAREAAFMIDGVLHSKTAYLVFNTKAKL